MDLIWIKYEIFIVGAHFPFQWKVLHLFVVVGVALFALFSWFGVCMKHAFMYVCMSVGFYFFFRMLCILTSMSLASRIGRLFVVALSSSSFLFLYYHYYYFMGDSFFLCCCCCFFLPKDLCTLYIKNRVYSIWDGCNLKHSYICTNKMRLVFVRASKQHNSTSRQLWKLIVGSGIFEVCLISDCIEQFINQ